MASSNLGTNSLEPPNQSDQFRLPTLSQIRPLREGIGWKLQILVFIAGVLVVVSRRPDALLNPQFFAEDGTVWYANAHAFGWFRSLFYSQNGYFQTLPRLAAALALLVPLQYAPLIMNAVGITFQVLPINFLLSWRSAQLAPMGGRALMAAIYIALPNTMELNASVEEGQWHLALLACLVVLARTPGRSRFWIAFDLSIVVLSGLTGPFCVLLLPIALVYWWFRRDPARLLLAGALLVTSLVQVSAILRTGAATRPAVGLGANAALLAELLAKHVYLAAMVGQDILDKYDGGIVSLMVAILGTAVVIYCLARARLELKLFLCFSLLVTAISLASPMVSMTVPQWQILAQAKGIRYWFFPMLAFCWSLVWCARESKFGAIRVAAVCILMSFLIGIPRDWSYPAYRDFHFPAYAKRFDAAAPGTLVNIPLFPPGWMLHLTKGFAACASLPVGYIDKPTPDAQLTGQAEVAGWAAALYPIRGIIIYVDRSRFESAALSLPRPEIDSRYPQSPSEKKGWAATLDLTHLARGKHELEARALGAGGCEADIAVMPIQIAK